MYRSARSEREIRACLTIRSEQLAPSMAFNFGNHAYPQNRVPIITPMSPFRQLPIVSDRNNLAKKISFEISDLDLFSREQFSFSESVFPMVHQVIDRNFSRNKIVKKIRKPQAWAKTGKSATKTFGQVTSSRSAFTREPTYPTWPKQLVSWLARSIQTTVVCKMTDKYFMRYFASY